MPGAMVEEKMRWARKSKLLCAIAKERQKEEAIIHKAG
jgi:hypothetical protein